MFVEESTVVPILENVEVDAHLDFPIDLPLFLRQYKRCGA